MDDGGTNTDDVKSCLVQMDDLSEDPSPEASDEHDTEFTRLTMEQNEEMREFLDSAAHLSVDKFDLREGFYSDSQPAASWHCLSEDEVTAHHRMGDFPHTWHPLSSLDPMIERHRSSHKSSPRRAENTSSAPSAHCKSEISGETVTNSGKSRPMLDKSRSCGVVLDESSSFLPASNFLNKESVSNGTVVQDASTGDKRILDEPENESVCLDDDDDAFTVQSPLLCEASRRQTPVVCENQMAKVSTGDILSKSPTTTVDSPQILKMGNGLGESEVSRPKVSFILGADPDEQEIPELPKVTRLSERSEGTARHPKSKKSSVHGRQRHRVPVLELYSRRRPGSEVSFRDALKHVPTEIDEAMTLEDVHLQEMASHRFDDSKGIHRRKISHHSALASVVHIGHVKHVRTAPVLPRRPHSEQQLQHHKMFVELDELCVGENKEWAWHEKARWIKFEEEVEETAQRWGKPHVSSLSFHSLLELRRRIESAAILLDLDAVDLPTIATNIVEHLGNTGQLHPDVKGQVLRALLLKHRHLSEQQAFIRRNQSQHNLLNFAQSQNSAANFRDPSDISPDLFLPPKAASIACPLGTPLVEMPQTVNDTQLKQFPNQSTHVKFKEMSLDAKIKSNPSVRSLLAVLTPRPTDSPSSGIRHAESHIIKRIPDGAETTSVLVGTVEFLDHPVMAFVRLLNACHLENLTEVPLPVRFIFVLMGPESANLDYHEIGRSVSTLMADPTFHDMAYVAESQKDLLDALNAFLHDSVVLPPGEWDKKTLLPIMDKARQKVLKKRTKKDQQKAAEKQEKHDDPLQRTGRLFGGLIKDVKRRYPLYLSDIKDGLNLQCIATFFFVYFACLSPAITFGGLLGDKTDKWMGVNEMLVSTAICGVLFSLLSGQPLIIIGATGPVLVFEEALYKMCNTFGIEFLPFRFWVSLWITIIAVVVVMLEGSFLVQYITRFTEEIFASLISLIFIYEVFKKLVLVFQKNPLKMYYSISSGVSNCGNSTDLAETDNDTSLLPVAELGHDSILDKLMEISTSIPYNDFTNEPHFNSSHEDQGAGSYGYPNTALLSLILTFGTFLMAHYLKHFRNSQFLGRSARRAIGDFGVPITIIFMVFVDFLIPDTFTEKLDVPDGIQPTAPNKRGWFVNPIGSKTRLPAWTMFAAFIPALLVFILLFMEAQITSMIVNKKDRKLKKGTGYHVDLFLIGLLSSVCGCLGLPFMCSATVRSVTHVSALSVFSRTHAPGEKPRLLEVKEQRVTSLAVHVMIGVSILLGPVLRHVPLPVLFGVFLYMGIASMSGIQMLHRVQLMFMPVKHHPDVGYARRVRLAKMNLYTIIQLGCLGLLWAIKSTQAALAFPFVLVLMVPVRLHILRFLFTPHELELLDKGEEGTSDDEEDEPDFYTQAHMPI